MPDVVNRTLEEYELGNVLMYEAEIVIARQMRKVIHVAGDEIVQGDDLVTSLQKQIHQMRPEESGPAGDH
jgi:hypothetical protein